MSDLNSRHPAPWQSHRYYAENHGVAFSLYSVRDANGVTLTTGLTKDLAEQICLWANAADVQRRRGWILQSRLVEDGGKTYYEWYVIDPETDMSPVPPEREPQATPEAALCAADAWVKEKEVK